MGAGNSKGEFVEQNWLENLEDHKKSINCIAVSDDKSLIATGSDDTTILMWTTKYEKTETLGTLEGHSEYITCLKIYGEYIISGSADKTIRKWDMAKCSCIAIYKGHSSRVSRVLCTGNVIFSTSYDKTTKAWNLEPNFGENEKNIECGFFREFVGHSNAVYSILFIPDLLKKHVEDRTLDFSMNDILITGSTDGTARSWNPETGATKQEFKGHYGPVVCMTTDPTGKILYTASNDHTIRAWHIISGQCVKIMEGHTNPIICMILVDECLYSGSEDGRARSWLREFGDCTRIYKGHKHSICAIKYNRGILYTGSGDATIHAFDSKSGIVKRVFIGHEAAVTNLAIIDKKLYSGSSDGTLKVWDISNIEGDTNQKLDNGLEVNEWTGVDLPNVEQQMQQIY